MRRRDNNADERLARRRMRDRGTGPLGGGPIDQRRDGAAARQAGWFWAKWPAFRFALLLGLLMGLFYAVTMTAFFQKRFYPAFVRLNAESAAAILRVLGDDAHSVGVAVVSPRYSVEIRRGCEGLEPTALYAAAVLAFPAPWRRRAVGALGGVAILALINVVRIVSLYYVGLRAPALFEPLHIAVWQPVFIATALALWVGWATWATRGREQRSHAAG